MALNLVLAILGIFALVFLAIVVLTFNSLVSLRNRVNNAWSQIDVQLKRRADLIPNLIETVKGYASHEKTVLENVTKARTALMNAGSIKEKADADNFLTGTLKSLFAVAENYPQLKANENFLQLQEELSGTESKVAYARQFYNDSVLEMNNKVQQFPSNIIAGMFGFAVKDFFEATATEREVPKVKF